MLGLPSIRTLILCSLLLHSIAFVSSTGQATSSTSTIQSIINALSYRNRPLQISLCCRHDALRSLLERGVDINARNASNQAPLNRAADKGKVDVVRLLIERGAEVDSCDKWGCTGYSRSRRKRLEIMARVKHYHRCKRIANFLRKHGEG